jgi:hypothetical protein
MRSRIRQRSFAAEALDIATLSLRKHTPWEVTRSVLEEQCVFANQESLLIQHEIST